MNREIKLRAYLDGEMAHNIERSGQLTTYLEKWAVMQFTGIKDTCNKDIYEGDIVEFYITKTPLHHVIIWYFGEYRTIDVRNYVSCQCCGNTIHARTGTKPLQRDWQRFKVVGNIHEHKELLERIKNKRI